MSDRRKVLAEQLITAAYEQLLAKIKGGEASAADFEQAMRYSKAAGVELLATPTNAAGGLARALTDSLPFAGDSAPTH